MIRREVQPKGEGKKPYTKACKIQRLVTPQRLQHKRHRAALKRRQAEKVKDEAVSGPCAIFLPNPGARLSLDINLFVHRPPPLSPIS